MKKLLRKVIGLALPLALVAVMAAVPASASSVKAGLNQDRTGQLSRRSISDVRSKSVNSNRQNLNENRGLVNRNSKVTGNHQFRHYRHLITSGPLNYRMRVDHNARLYNLPKGLKDSQAISSVDDLNLLHRWVPVNAVANTNAQTGYYRFGFNRQNYWILGRNLSFDLKALRGHNRRVERVISSGERLINHSHYHERSRRYDCSSFMSHIFARAGAHLASTTYGQIYNGRRERHLQRGDLIFFNDHEGRDRDGDVGGRNCHVGVYLGHGLFLDDSPFSDNHGVDVSSLHDPMWSSLSRKHPAVHKFNHVIRKIV